MFERLGVSTFKLRYLIVIAWVVLAVLSVKFAPSIASSGAADQAAFLPAYAPSVQATEAIEKAFPGASSSSSATITLSRDGGLTDADHAYAAEVAAWATSADAPAVLRDAVTTVDTATSRPELASMLRSSDGVLELVTVNLNISSAGDAADAVVTALRDHLASTAPSGLAAHVTGAAGITTDYMRAIKSGTDSTTIVTIILVVVILLLIYRAPLAALVPLVTIGAAFIVARGVLGVLAAAGWGVSSLLDTFIVVLVFGVGTDYAIFLISRYREEVRHEDWHEAVRDTVKRIGAVISASAATVIVGLGAMAFADFGMIQTTGPALGVAVFITLLAGLTLAPALLGIFGHYLFWPLHTKPVSAGEPGGFFARLAAAVSRHPGVVTVGLVVLLAIPILYVPQARTNFDTLAELPKTSDARIGYDIVAEHLGKGQITQSTALITGSGATDMLAPASLARLRDTVLALEATDGVDTVTSLVTPNGDGQVPDGFRPSVQLATIADELDSSGDGSASSSDSSALLGTEVSDGLSSALDYVSALGAAYPDVAARAEYRATTQAIADAQDVVTAAREQSRVSTQLRALASALTSTSALAGSSEGADRTLLADYLVELAAAYPEVRSLPAYADATAAAAVIAEAPTATAAVDASTALQSLAAHFDAQPDATLSPESLAGTDSAKEATKRAKETFAALPVAFRGLSGVFAGRSDDIFVPVGLGGDSSADLEKAVDAFVSGDRSATRFYVSTSEDPYSTAAFRTLRNVRDDLTAAAPTFGAGASAYLGGATNQLADVQDVLQKDFLRVGIITVVGILLVLILLLRALVAPVYLVATVLLSYGSALGLSAFLFQEVLGHPGISFYLPLIVFVLLVALGADYNIFLMSRVREESETRPIRDGIRIASGRTGAVITSAGLILAGTFGSMATAPLIVLFQVGVAVAIGVLIDTFLVRSILVPAITTLVGDRAWWPSGALAGRGLVPVAAAVEGGVLDAAAEPRRRSLPRLVVALALAALVPLTFAGLIAWSQAQGAGAPTPAAVVELDEGTTVTLADGTVRTVDLGADLSRQLTAGEVTDTFAWTATTAADAADGLSSGRYGAVLTIPADFSRTVTAAQADTTGARPPAALSLDMAGASGGDASEVAREVRTAIAASAARTATASYVEDVLVAVSTAGSAMGTAVDDARSIADRSSSIADDAAGLRTVSGELVSGLDQLAEGATSAADGATELADGTQALATGTEQLAQGAASVASGVNDASSGATALTSGTDQLASGLATMQTQTADLPAQTEQLATGAAQLSDGAASADTGAAELASGLATMQAQTADLPAQTEQLATGAAQLSDGIAKATAGAKELADGLATMQAQTADLPAQTRLLAMGAQQLAEGIAEASLGATKLAAGLAEMKTKTTGMAAGAQLLADNAAAANKLAGQTATDAEATADLATPLAGSAGGLAGGLASFDRVTMAGLVAGCAGSGASQDFCDLVAAASVESSGLAATASAVANDAGTVAIGAATTSAEATGVSRYTVGIAAGTKTAADAAPALEAGIAGAAAGSAELSAGLAALTTGANELSGGIQRLADGMPALVSGIAQASTGATQLSSGLTSLSDGAQQLATGTQQLAAGMPALTSGIAQASTGATQLSSGLTSLSDGAQQLATGTQQLADGMPALTSGIAQASTGATQLSTGLTSLSDGAQQLATGTQQLAAGMPALTSGIAQASTGATDVASGMAQLDSGLIALATGSDDLAAGADATATGASQLAAGTSDATGGLTQMQDAVVQLADGARIVESRSGLLAQDGTEVSDRATTVADGLDAVQRSSTSVPVETRPAVAERAADPVVVEASNSGATGGSGAGIAPYVMALALWLGALVAFLVLPASRRGRRRWMGPIAAFGAALALGAVGAVLMIAGLSLVVGIDIARMPALVAVAALAAAAFAAIVQALVLAFGDRGWLVGLLLAGVQAAACASPVPFATLPAPLDVLHPFMPVTWAADAFRACIDGTAVGLLPAIVALTAALVVALLASLAVAYGRDRAETAAPVPA